MCTESRFTVGFLVAYFYRKERVVLSEGGVRIAIGNVEVIYFTFFMILHFTHASSIT